MSSKIEQLKKLVGSSDWDRQTHELVASLERQMELAQAKDKLRDHLVIKEIVATLEGLVESISKGLSENENLADDQRRQMFADRRAYNLILSVFSGKQVEQSEQQINQLYEKASQQSVRPDGWR